MISKSPEIKTESWKNQTMKAFVDGKNQIIRGVILLKIEIRSKIR